MQLTSGSETHLSSTRTVHVVVHILGIHSRVAARCFNGSLRRRTFIIFYVSNSSTDLRLEESKTDLRMKYLLV
jgi:hypothetical protein